MNVPVLDLVGAPGSPYSRKMRALLRYRRIPHRWIVRGSREDRNVPDVPVPLIPVLVIREEGTRDRAMIDSTFQIRHLDERYAERSVVPDDPAMAFVDALLEDWADEWMTKAMFHYRWTFDEDVEYAAAVLPLWRRIDAPDDELASFSARIRDRQVGRLGVVGSNRTTAPVIEESYRRTLRLLDAHLHSAPFLMGRRPGASDFALFGQLSQLVLLDPTSMGIARREAPRVAAWCDLVEDLSGLEPDGGDWISRDGVPVSLVDLLGEAGRVYVPFLLANGAALERGDEQVECEIEERKWVQRTFPYQGKCLRWLRDAYAGLDRGDRRAVDALLAGTGCEALFRA